MTAAAPRTIGVLLLAGLGLTALFADRLAVASPSAMHPDHVFAPPMRPHLIDADGRWRAPFVYPLVLENRLERRYVEDRRAPMRLRWLSDGRLVSAPGPWFPLGTDDLGRDVFSRVVIGARLSLGVALLAALLAAALGALVGGLAGAGGRVLDDGLMRAADLVVALPALYVIVTLRAALPLVLSPLATFACMVLVLGAVGWPIAARGTRAIVARERGREYAEAARAAGAGPLRILLRHLLPAAAPFLGVQLTLLVPAFILAEATLSYVGLGFTDPSASWGVMLRSADGSALASSPWLLAPAGGILWAVLAINLLAAGRQLADGEPTLRL